MPQRTSVDVLNADPEIRNAQRGQFTGQYATFAQQLPGAWSPETRNMVVAQQIARDKGYNTGGLDASSGEFSDPDSGAASWIAQHGYLIPAALTAAVGGPGFFSALGGHGGATAPTLEAMMNAEAAGGGAAATTGGAAAAGGGMGFLDTLKKGFDLFNTGKDAFGALSQTAGGIEKDRAAGLINQAKLQQQQDLIAQARARLALDAPGMEASNAVKGDVLANAQDVSFSGLPSYIHIPTISGGLRPSMLSANSRQLGQNMSRQALLNNLSGSDVPALTPLPESTGYDTALQGVGTVSGFLNALGQRNGSRSPSSSTAPTEPISPLANPFATSNPFGTPTDAITASTSGIDPNLMSPEELQRLQEAQDASAGE